MVSPLTTIEKQSWEQPILGMDFAGKIGNSEAAIASIVSIEVFNADGSMQSDVTILMQGSSLQRVNMKPSGGVNGKKYKITVRVIDSDGQWLEHDGFLRIRDL